MVSAFRGSAGGRDEQPQPAGKIRVVVRSSHWVGWVDGKAGRIGSTTSDLAAKSLVFALAPGLTPGIHKYRDDELKRSLHAIVREHEVLHCITDAVAAAGGSMDNREFVGARLAELADFVGEHFMEEERLMQQLDFPPWRLHCGVHENMIRNLSQTIHQFEVTPARVTLERLKGLCRCYEAHARHSDARFCRFLQTKCGDVPVSP